MTGISLDLLQSDIIHNHYHLVMISQININQFDSSLRLVSFLQKSHHNKQPLHNDLVAENIQVQTQLSYHLRQVESSRHQLLQNPIYHLLGETNPPSQMISYISYEMKFLLHCQTA